MQTRPVPPNSAKDVLSPLGGAPEGRKLQKSETPAPVPLNPSRTTSPNYQVKLSDEAKKRADEKALAKNIAMKTPDVRENRVQALKDQVQKGTYKVDSEKIADGIIKESIKDHLSTSDRVDQI